MKNLDSALPVFGISAGSVIYGPISTERLFADVDGVTKVTHDGQAVALILGEQGLPLLIQKSEADRPIARKCEIEGCMLLEFAAPKNKGE